jgi:hypothetical protein
MRKRINAWLAQRQLQRERTTSLDRLNRVFRNRALLDTFLLNPLLAEAQKSSGASGARSESGSALAKLAVPWRMLERRCPRLRTLRVLFLRQLLLLLLSRGLRTLSDRLLRSWCL